ncbi:unnamed protein product [Ostreobium quekettii]|uniref:Uncharacterized protein n=1 Tax=Ostreobium quekettii TaxID=121088 RepID=A0A8S1J146_9CHLO|nr:unnamed protein product [Ostreobium quekettii]
MEPEPGRADFSLEGRLCWDDVAARIRENTYESLRRLGRSAERAKMYKAGKQELLEEFVSIVDAIKINKLGFSYTFTDGGKKIAADAQPSDSQVIAFAENDFPYSLEDGIEHHVLWSTDSMSDQQILEAIAQHRDGWEAIWFRNPDGLSSVPGVWHVHVISRRLSKPL